jgi:hypothetical protein
MIVDNLDIRWAIQGPNEADAILVVDPNTVLTFSLTHEFLELVSQRDGEIFQMLGPIQVVKPSASHPPEMLRTPPPGSRCRTPAVDILAAMVPERQDHDYTIIPYIDIYINATR